MPESTKDLARDRLLALKDQLESAETTGQEAEQTVELDQTRVGRLSRMDAMQMQAMSVETGRRRRIMLREIEAALDRVKTGDYGNCEECGQAIDPRRLEIDPTARLCIACAQAQE